MRNTLIAAFVLLSTIVSAADVKVEGEVPKPLTLTTAEMATWPQQTVTLKGKEYKGVTLAEVMKRAGRVTPDSKHSANIPYYVVVSAKDGYQAVFALVELDPAFTDKVVLLTTEGRLVVPDEKLPGRWVRDVTSLTVKKL